jgi:hypothetical protein
MAIPMQHRGGDMKIRNFSPGDLAARMGELVVVVGPTTSGKTQILSPTGIEWEYTHDLVHADELLNCN